MLYKLQSWCQIVLFYFNPVFVSHISLELLKVALWMLLISGHGESNILDTDVAHQYQYQTHRVSDALAAIVRTKTSMHLF